MVFTMEKPWTVKQQPNESLASHHKRFKNAVEIAEVQWGSVAPVETAKLDRKCMDEAKRMVF